MKQTKILANLFVFILLFLFSSQISHATVIISEFSVNGTEFIELNNSDESNSVDLSNYKLQFSNPPSSNTLSGTLPRRGFLTFYYTNKLDNDGGRIQLLDASDNVINGVTYGTEVDIGAPSSSQSAYYNPSALSWNLTSTITKGWCNPAGYSGCPTIADIVNQINSTGVTTNLGDMSDYSHITGLYFEKTGFGRITFNNELNFTDKDTMSWMQTLDQKLNLGTKGIVGLDAETVKNLFNTQATLTMYGLTYGNPEINVTNTDGSQADNGIASGLSYLNGTLTFTAGHFTTFTAREKTSSSSTNNSGSGWSASSCTSTAPIFAPTLFQINVHTNYGVNAKRLGKYSAKLFFTPVNENSDGYYIAYGTKSGIYPYGVEYNKSNYNGVLSFDINFLNSGTYYFKIRAKNNCMPGPWGNEMKIKTSSRNYYKSSI
jgi:hypothetical protein